MLSLLMNWNGLWEYTGVSFLQRLHYACHLSDSCTINLSLLLIVRL